MTWRRVILVARKPGLAELLSGRASDPFVRGLRKAGGVPRNGGAQPFVEPRPLRPRGRGQRGPVLGPARRKG
jgi:hypothetical protein